MTNSPEIGQIALKKCSKCGREYPADTQHFYRHPGGRHGVTPRCKPCTNEDNKLSDAKRKERDPEKIRAQCSVRATRYYYRNIEASRAAARANAAKARSDPEKRAKINMRKRANGAKVSQEEFDALLAKQNGRCAICNTLEPASLSGSRGWNIDHCHKSGRVRFVLCGPCNRGLGAFRDDPIRLRRAADLLESIEILG